MKKLLLVVLALMLTGCQKEMDLDYIEDRGYVVMGLDDTFAPMGFRDKAGNLVGFDVDLAVEVFERAGLELRFQPIDWALKETELNTGNIDMIWNGYTITDERAEMVLFSDPYLNNAQAIITLRDSAIETIADLDGLVVATQASSSSFDAIIDSELMNTREESDIILYDTYNEAFIDLEAGRVDAIVADEIMARYYISQRESENYMVLEENLGFEQYGIGFRKESTELAALVSEILAEMKEDGATAEISIKWFAEDIVK